MSLTQPDFLPPNDSPAESYEPGRGIRLEDVLRLIFAGLVILGLGLALGGFTFQQLAARGTGYFVAVACLAIILTALTFYRFQPALVLAMGVLWLHLGGTPDVAQGSLSGAGRSLYPIELGTVFLLFVWVLRGIMLRQFQIVKTPINAPLIAYLAFNVWSAVNGWMFWDQSVTLHSLYPRTPPQVIILELALRLLSVGMFWLFAGSLTDAKCLRWASFALLLPGVDAFLARITHVIPDSGSPYVALLETVVACTLLAWLLEYPETKPSLRFWGWLTLALIFFQTFILSIGWVSGWYGMTAGLLLIAWLKSKRLFFGLITLGAVVVLAIRPFLEIYVVHDVATNGDLDRFSMIHAAFLYAMHYPLGIGPGNYRAYNAYFGSRSMWNTSGYTSAHDFYAQMLSELGFGGLILTVIFVVVGLVMLTRFYRNSPPGFSRTMILGITGMWAGMCAATGVGDYLIPVYYNGGLVTLASTIYTWIGLGIAVALARSNGALALTLRPPSVPQPAARPAFPGTTSLPRRGTP